MIRSRAVLVAIGIDWEGRREVLGVEMANRESSTSWKELLQVGIEDPCGLSVSHSKRLMRCVGFDFEFSGRDRNMKIDEWFAKPSGRPKSGGVQADRTSSKHQRLIEACATAMENASTFRQQLGF